MAVRPGRPPLTRRALVATCLGLAAATSGCGNLVGDLQGYGTTGVTVDGQGRPSIVAFVCRDRVDRISIVADRTGLREDEENMTLATYRLRSPQDGLLILDLAEPGASFARRTPFVVPTDRRIIATASGPADSDTETSQVTFGAKDLETLRPGLVYVDTARPGGRLRGLTTAAFRDEARRTCADD